MEYKKKLIEVALPLEAINRESAREKSIRHGHPSTLHLWWSRKPLATARAVLFASLVDDPSAHPDRFPTEEEQEKERQRLFGIIEELVKWENSNNEEVLNKAREEILKSTDGNPPPFYDPFCGGGSIPLEAQRLGLKAYAGDLNPVAVLITKALIEIPPKFANMPPVNPEVRSNLDFKNGWKGASGLAEDVRYYGKWMRDEAEKRIGHLYPKVELPAKFGGGEGTVIAWLFCRKIRCPNPACGVEMPLTSKFLLSQKQSRYVWARPVYKDKELRFEVTYSSKELIAGTIDRRGAKCLHCGTPVTLEYIRAEGKNKKINNVLMGIVVEGNRQRLYLTAKNEHYPCHIDYTDFLMDIEMTPISGYFNPPIYGYDTLGSMFSDRQRKALECFTNLVLQARDKCLADSGNIDYANAIAIYLTLGVGRLSNRLSMFSIWNTTGEKIEQTFSEQGVGMAWDFAEANPFSSSTGSWIGSLEWIPKCLELLPLGEGNVFQNDAAEKTVVRGALISTDPPYYSSITYADFADFFYGTFRKALKSIFSDLFITLTTPKEQEIVAAWHRFEGDQNAAGINFRRRLQDAVKFIVEAAHEDYPITFYYAFKEKDLGESAEQMITAWESILGVLVESGLQIVNTWPLRTERTTGRKARKNSLASSIVLGCRIRKDSVIVTRRDFIKTLREEFFKALNELKENNIAPIDLAQAAIGPGMSVFSRYSKVLEADGNPMTVRTALQIINQELDVYLTAQEGDMDTDSRFCIAWYEQFGMNEAPFGEADVLARAKNTSVGRLEEKGVVYSAKGKVRLLKREELDAKWSPVSSSSRDMIWMCTQQLVKALENEGEIKTAELVHEIRGDVAENAKALAYRLYTIAERKGWTEEAYAYNALVVSWPDIQRKAEELAARSYEQQTLF